MRLRKSGCGPSAGEHHIRILFDCNMFGGWSSVCSSRVGRAAVQVLPNVGNSSRRSWAGRRRGSTGADCAAEAMGYCFTFSGIGRMVMKTEAPTRSNAERRVYMECGMSFSLIQWMEFIVKRRLYWQAVLDRCLQR
jgi:hypothetical protein